MIQPDAKIKVLKKPDVTDLSGEKVMIDFETGNYFMLKGAANDIWDLLADDVTPNAIVDGLMAVYDVDEAACRESTLQFLAQMEANGFIAAQE